MPSYSFVLFSRIIKFSISLTDKVVVLVFLQGQMAQGLFVSHLFNAGLKYDKLPCYIKRVMYLTKIPSQILFLLIWKHPRNFLFVDPEKNSEATIYNYADISLPKKITT